MLRTEMRNPRTTHIDQMDTMDILRCMQAENLAAVQAVERPLPSIAAAVDAITAAFQAGGRLFYIGAGTSGRLGVLDAAECPPTFGVPADKVVGIIAGGDASLRRASESAEDDPQAGAADLRQYALTAHDVVVGISAAGGAAYVLRALEYAAGQGCVTVGITSNEGSPLDMAAAISICTDTGAEVVTGSTRLKAGTAQKLVLNMLTTASMIRCGYVYENLMIHLRPTNSKLRKRMIRIVCELAACDEYTAEQRLIANGWDIPKAVSPCD